MYIKAENVRKYDHINANNELFKDKEQGNGLRLSCENNDVITDKPPNLMARRVNSNNISSINSLNFLHRPQRVTQMKTNLFPDEEIAKNTNLNKQLSSADHVSSTSSIPTDFGLSPTSISINKNLGVFNSPCPIDEHMLPFPPIYKKSGELVKSSLKRRSQSLPASPHINNENENKNLANVRPGGRLQRSKSVHFDQKTPVKYFCEDESPIDVSEKAKEQEELLSFQHKPVNRLYDDDNEGEDGYNAANDRNVTRDDQILSMGIDSISLKDNNKNLRKSKRFNALLKTHKSETKGVLMKPKFNKCHNNDESDNNSLKPNYYNGRVVGLYNVNFPILSNKNPKSLKLNIFINLSRNKKCFLQDLSLYMQRDSSSLLATSSSNDSSNNTSANYNKNTTRIIVGRVLVKNIFFDKKVLIKYTWNNWRTSQDIECVYVSDGDGVLPGTNMDIFNFIIDDVNKQDSKAKLEFCIHYIARNDHERQEFWDNNDGKNYKVDCIMDGFHNPFAVM